MVTPWDFVCILDLAFMPEPGEASECLLMEGWGRDLVLHCVKEAMALTPGFLQATLSNRRN